MDIFAKNNRGTSFFGDIFISYDKQCLIKKLPVPTKRATILSGSNNAMHFYVCYWYVLLSKITFDLSVLNCGYLSSGHYFDVSKM